MLQATMTMKQAVSEDGKGQCIFQKSNNNNDNDNNDNNNLGFKEIIKPEGKVNPMRKRQKIIVYNFFY